MTIQHIYKTEDQHCSYNRDIFTELKEDLPELEIEEIEADTPQGKQLQEQFGFASYPAVVVNGSLYAVGGVDKEEIKKYLTT